MLFTLPVLIRVVSAVLPCCRGVPVMMMCDSVMCDDSDDPVIQHFCIDFCQFGRRPPSTFQLLHPAAVRRPTVSPSVSIEVVRLSPTFCLL